MTKVPLNISQLNAMLINTNHSTRTGSKVKRTFRPTDLRDWQRDLIPKDLYLRLCMCNSFSSYVLGAQLSCAIAQTVSRRLPTAAAQARALSGHVGFVVDKAALRQVFSEYFGSLATHSNDAPHSSSPSIRG
jgi:hypothetical protein